jgi:sugar phosphate isomerase/epimerase
MKKRKYSIILGNLGNTCDRFLSSGYKEPLDKRKMIEQAASIKGVTGIELVGTWDVDDKSVDTMRTSLKAHKLECASIIPDLFAQKRWGRGALASADAAIRRQAVAEVNRMTDIAVELGGSLINLWPGQDGYDYPLAADFIQERGWMLEAIAACAEHARKKGVRIALEFKMKEPRTHSYLARTADALLVANQPGLDNVGVCIDTGHAFLAYENVGESIALLKLFGDKLFHMHFNDNFGSWDDDMIVGSIRLPEYFEMLYWLERTGYAGWYSMDQYPYREDGYGAVRSSVLFVQKMNALLDKAGADKVEKLVRRRDPVATADFIRTKLLA